MLDLNSILLKLRKNGLRVTPQRCAILEHLIGNKNHPPAEAIYEEVKKRYPMMSLSTVYNTLDALLAIGEIQELLLEDKRIRFDPDPSPHHHFQCLKCGKVKDIFREIDIPRDKIDENRIESWRVYFYGTCSDCL